MSYYDSIDDTHLEYLKKNDLKKYQEVVRYRKDSPWLFKQNHKEGLNVDIQAHIPHSRVDVELWYPGANSNKINQVQVGLCDVRAADDIRIEYDFERDGWSIKQQLFWEGPESHDLVEDVDHWYEVAFVQAWGQQRKMTAEQYQHWLTTNEMPAIPAEPQDRMWTTQEVVDIIQRAQYRNAKDVADIEDMYRALGINFTSTRKHHIPVDVANRVLDVLEMMNIIKANAYRDQPDLVHVHALYEALGVNHGQ